MNLSRDEAWTILNSADEVCSAAAVAEAIRRVASEITGVLAQRQPLVLSVMGGAVVFTGQLLPLLKFPLDFDYIHVSRYDNETAGGLINWKVAPRENVKGRTVLVLDDILDEGQTLHAIRGRILNAGAQSFYCAVLADKATGKEKPIRANFVGVTVPNRYVFGCGMDAYGTWRNLPAIYALKQQ
ncbi:MAG: hypoxanthine-guanine phosphoribosyltransferase [Burkholderiales bacterium]